MMMSEQTLLSGVRRADSPPGWAGLKAAASTAFYNSAVLVLVATWIVFWGLVMRIHIIQGQLLSASVVGLLFVIPAIVGLSAYFGPLPDPGRLVPG